MIVTCPACRSRYRCNDRPQADATARCSACNESFALGTQRRSYRLARSGSSVSDTLLVTALLEAPDVGEECGPSPDPLLEGRPADTRIDMPIGGSPPISATVLDHPELPLPEIGPPAKEAEPEIPAAKKGWMRLPQSVGELLVALVPAALGGGLAYYFAGPFGQSPSLSAALGATVGLLFGWACLIWITRED